MQLIKWVLALLAIQFIVTSQGLSAASLRTVVFVSIDPQAYVLAAVGGDKIQIETMVKSGSDPHTYQPSPRQITELARSNIYFSIGLPFETILVGKFKATNNKLKIFDMSAGIDKLPVSEDHDDHHFHGEGILSGDPHIWLDPLLVIKMGKNAEVALSALLPEYQAYFAERQRQLASELTRLDSDIRAKLAPFKGRSFLVYHPSFAYFAQRYGLRQEAIEKEGKDATALRLAEIVANYKRKGMTTVFVQRELSTKSSEAIAAMLGGTTVVLDTLARDLPQSITVIASALEKSMNASSVKK